MRLDRAIFSLRAATVERVSLLVSARDHRLSNGGTRPFLRMMVAAPDSSHLTYPLWQQALVAGVYEDHAEQHQLAVGLLTTIRVAGRGARPWATMPLSRSVVPTRGGYSPAQVSTVIRRNTRRAHLAIRSLRVVHGIFPAVAIEVSSTLPRATLAAREPQLLNTLETGIVADPTLTRADGIFVSLRDGAGVNVLRFGYAARLGTAYTWRRAS